MKKFSKLLVLIVTAIVFNFSAASCGVHPMFPQRVARPYYYYPNSQVYYNPGTRSYFYLSGGRWISAPRLPRGVRLNEGGRVLMNLRTATPFTNFSEHRLAHPPLLKASPAGLAAPGLASPRLSAPRLAAPGLASPRLSAPGLSSPRLSSPGLPLPGVTKKLLRSPGLILP